MKKVNRFSLIILMSLIFGKGFCTNHEVAIGIGGMNAFSPPSFTASIGDTVTWLLLGGIHSVEGMQVPSGALPILSQTMSNMGETYIYIITTAGTYNYQCGIVGPSMFGSFIVNGVSTDLRSLNAADQEYLYPCPTQGKLIFDASQIEKIEIYNLLGEQLISVNYPVGLANNKEIDISHLQAANYIAVLIKRNKELEKKLIVKID